MFFYIDPAYFWWVMLPTMIIALVTQIYLRNTFTKWAKVPNSSKKAGPATADTLFRNTDLNPIPIERVRGSLTDHYDPGANVVRLSDPIATQATIASMAVTAHELGHVEQYQNGSALIRARSFLLPALQFSPMLSYLSFMFGILFNMAGLVWMGIVFFSLMVLFTLLTLPVEFDASRRAMRLLDEAGMLQTEDDKKGAKAVLRAAALTYVAAAITSVLQLLYYISIAKQSTNSQPR
jgi:Zn-dependent membrane protease YugP